jgi:N-methylhydantoinase A/oxoprolinase/acetone carboxylase beta subunit
VAEILGIGTVVVPTGSGTASAFGLLCAPVTFEQVRTLHGRIGDLPWSELGEILENMEWEGRRHLDAAGVEPEQISLERSCEMRYVGQANEIAVALPEEGELNEIVLRERFERGYKSLYKRVNADLPVETLTWHVKLSGPAPEIPAQEGTGRDPRAALKGHREAYMKANGGLRTVPVYDRYALAGGASVQGPAVVEERGSTVVLPDGCQAQVDDVGNLVARTEGS